MKKKLITLLKKITSFDLKLTSALSLIYSSTRYDYILHYINLRFCQLCYKALHFLPIKKNPINFSFFEDTHLCKSFSDIAHHMRVNIDNERKFKKKRKLFIN